MKKLSDFLQKRKATERTYPFTLRSGVEAWTPVYTGQRDASGRLESRWRRVEIINVHNNDPGYWWVRTIDCEHDSPDFFGTWVYKDALHEEIPGSPPF